MSKPLVFGDTSVILAWLNNEQDKPLDVIGSIINSWENGKLVLGVSVMSRTELLYASNGAKMTQWKGFLERSDLQEVNIDRRVAEEAAKIRRLAKYMNKKLPSTDALILASASVHQASELHTFDEHQLAINGVCVNGESIFPMPIRSPVIQAAKHGYRSICIEDIADALTNFASRPTIRQPFESSVT